MPRLAVVDSRPTCVMYICCWAPFLRGPPAVASAAWPNSRPWLHCTQPRTPHAHRPAPSSGATASDQRGGCGTHTTPAPAQLRCLARVGSVPGPGPWRSWPESLTYVFSSSDPAGFRVVVRSHERLHGFGVVSEDPVHLTVDARPGSLHRGDHHQMPIR